MSVWSSSGRFRGVLCVGLGLAAGASTVPAVATANMYTVVGCHDAQGARLPGSGGFREVRPPAQSGAALDDRFFTFNACQDGGKGALGLADGAIAETQPLIVQDASAKVELRFTAPPNTVITRYQIGKLGGTISPFTRRPAADGGQGSVEIGDSGQIRFSSVGQGFIPVGSIFVPVLPAPVSSVFVRVGCEPTSLAGRCTGRESIAALNIEQTRVRLLDSSVPTAANVTGLLATGGVLKGTASVELDAEDSGPGVAGSTLFVDGESRGFVPVTSSTCRGLPVGAGYDTDIAYDEPVPCPVSTHVVKTLDTGALPDGLHDVRVEAYSASGNIGQVFQRTIAVKNNPTPNGTNAGPGAKLTASLAFGGKTGTSRISLRFGQGGVRLTGKVQGQGGPVVGGLVDIGVKERSFGARTVTSPVRTGSDGSFSFTVPAGRSQDVTASYRAFLESAPVTEKTLRIDARPRLSFNVRRAGRTATFSGTLFGAPPASRKVVVLEVRRGKGFQPFGTVRMKHGRYSLKFRFLSGGRYTFRARVLAEAGWPFLTATSATRRLTVR